MLVRILFILLILSVVVQAQDTTTIEPVTLIGGHIIFNVTEDQLLVQFLDGIGEYERREVLLYDISSPAQPDLIDRCLRMSAWIHFEHDFVSEQADIMFFDTIMVATINRAHYWGSMDPGQAIGPLDLVARQTGVEDNLWQITIHDSLVEWMEPDSGTGYNDYWLLGDLARYDDFLFSSAGSWGIRIYDLTDLREPELVDTLGFICRHLEIAGDRLVFFHYEEGERLLAVADISDPASPDLIGEIEWNSWEYPSFFHNGKQVNRGLLYLSTTAAREGDPPVIIVFDIASDDAPEEVGRFEAPWESYDGRFINFTINNERLFVKHQRYVDMYDLSEPLEPEYLITMETDTGNYFQVMVKDNLMFLAKGGEFFEYDTTIFIYDLNDLSLPLEKLGNPSVFSLHPAYPNPFNSTTTIRYSLPNLTHVSLGIYDPLGREVGSLFEGYKRAGFYSMNLNANGLPSGLYFVRLEASGQSLTRKLMLTR